MRTIMLVGTLLAGWLVCGIAEGAASGDAAPPFGGSLHVADVYAAAAPNPVYSVLPITVECRARLQSKSGYNILVSNEPKTSGTHWEIYSDKETGAFCAYLPSYSPFEIKSNRDITDGQWHSLAFIFDGQSARLYVDARQVAEQKVKKVFHYPDTGPLVFGHMDGVPPAGEIDLDEVRISRVARTIDKVPAVPFTVDAETVGLWHFDEDAKAAAANGYADLSRTRNPAKLKSIDTGEAPAAPTGHTRWQDMDFGPFFTSTLGSSLPANNVTNKGISVHLGKDRKAAVCFDTDLLRVSAGWTGDFVKIYPEREGLAQHPDVAGTPVFGTLNRPGWSKGDDFNDPRPDKAGPLPADWAKYKGLYLSGDEVIFSYTVGGVAVLERPEVETRDGQAAITRELEISPSRSTLKAALCDMPGAMAQSDANVLTFRSDGRATVVGLVAGNSSASMKVEGGTRAILSIPPHEQTVRCKVVIAAGPVADEKKLAAAAASAMPPAALAELAQKPARREQQTVVTRGALGREPGPYAVDTLTAPDDNPWKSFLRFGGLDFFSNGDAAICSISGDVWIVSGIDEKLDKLTWRRFATGLHQPLGLKILKDTVYVLGRDQITRLHDLNGDGTADFYENFNNDCKVTPGGHEYTTCLETDPEGNFYYEKCGSPTAHGGTLLKVSADGSKLEVFATGMRNPNGMGISPTGQIITADNQGEWVPASRIDEVKQGAFLGYEPMAHRSPPPEHPGYPICWMPQNCDNSSAGQTWVTSDKWGGFGGEMLHTSYGAAAIYHVMTERVNGKIQGGVYRFPLTFGSGIMRARFNPRDGQLYVCGLKGWQTSGIRDGVFQRVRYTGKPVQMPAALHVHRNGVLLTFTSPLDPKTAADAESWSVLQWNYRWTSNYGSAQWSLARPGQQGYDTVEVKSAHILKDGKSVFLEIPNVQPVMQMQITYSVDAADGTALQGDVFNTIHELGPEFKLEELAAPVEKSSASPNTVPQAAGQGEKPRKIVLIAGKKSHGLGEHEYEKGCKLLKHCLDTSPNVKNVKTEVVLNGWPENSKVLEDADTILLYCDGSDRDESAHPLLHDDRLEYLGKLMNRGVGFVSIHYTIFVPTEKGGKQFQNWLGGYFDYDSKGPSKNRENWYSTLGTAETTTTAITPEHPILRGFKPFTTQTEYYWKIHFRANDQDDPRFVPLLTFDPKGKNNETTIAWAVERADHGRGFGFTEGHYYSNWKIDSFRRTILNALLWTAHAEVPPGGVDSELPKALE